MAISINREDYGRLIDFYGGLADVEAKLLRVLHAKSFSDDPTRLLRLIRFEQRLGFSIERHTLSLLRRACSANVLLSVNPHRLRDELRLLLGENKPLRCIKRLQQTTGLGFIDPQLHLSRKDFSVLERIEKALFFYDAKFNKENKRLMHSSSRSALCLLPLMRKREPVAPSQMPSRKVDEWLVYLMGILEGLPLKNTFYFLDRFGLRKGERIRILSVKESMRSVEELKGEISPHKVYKILHPLSFESMVFFYAYFAHACLSRNITNYLERLVHVRLRIGGEDLRRAGISPSRIYGSVLEQLICLKLDNGFRSKQEELSAAKKIAARICRPCARA